MFIYLKLYTIRVFKQYLLVTSYALLYLLLAEIPSVDSSLLQKLKSIFHQIFYNSVSILGTPMF